MVDYYAHMAALKSITDAFGAQVADPKSKQTFITIQDNPSYAALGTLIDHLLYHSGTSRIELRRLTRASQLWRDIREYIDAVAQVRSELESMVQDSSQPDIVVRYNAIHDTLKNYLQPKFTSLVGRLQSLFTQLRDLTHIVPHGQGADLSVNQWNWRDLYLSRASGLFAETLYKKAMDNGSEEAMAFAYGVSANYVSNAVGSNFQNRATGGARRSHPHRDRVAGYSIGAWIRKNMAGMQLSTTQLKSLLTIGSPVNPLLPPDIKTILEKSLTEVYGVHGLTNLPDLDKGYRNMLKHLELLDSFKPLLVPQMIDNTVYIKILSSGTTFLDAPPGTPPPQDPAPSSGGGSWTDDIPWWAWVLFAVCIALVAICYLIGICAPAQKDPYPGPFQHDEDGTSAVRSYLTSDESLQSVKFMFNLHMQLYDMANTSLRVMKFLGLVYPEDGDLPAVEFKQFTQIPFKEVPDFKKPIIDKDMFLGFPASAEEMPRIDHRPFFPGDFPDRIFTNPNQSDVSTFGSKLWMAQLQGTDADKPFNLSGSNLNLDSDREFLQLCWELATGGSTLDNSLNFNILGYTKI
ncbi:hypothetical protein [Xanthocytophaga agilis]|uniref:Uncharacterized protein n=1 Tax=Xanthocytophaga agilis TaxID=3048010 RepID=A0AAE3R261_9BACT|nr:hypothetical protein [Xanthocytophaga agilis]MDJ1501725.1 hypothetical protein [Xanthocytophaga agilis]